MKVEIDLPEIPGYEYTGEYSRPRQGDDYLDPDGVLFIGSTGCSVNLRHILRKKRWRARRGFNYHRLKINGFGPFVNSYDDDHSTEHDSYYESGNYFKTKEEAGAMADKFKKLLKGEG